jgi:hypothetical protein
MTVAKEGQQVKGNVIQIALGIMLCICLAGCSVYKASRQPGLKPIELFRVGTHRDLLLANFGAPTTSFTKEGKKYEMFCFTQGYSEGAKTTRAVVHGTADVFTLGLWEIVGTPTEAIFDGTDMAYEVSYDESDCVDSVTLLKKKMH